ncbi:MAG: DUF4256 domain-containing protein [Erysipelotrichaceae bacterium]|nr:DUF4256 domain-containing protein [Erysipelotrichaceae bacterium]
MEKKEKLIPILRTRFEDNMQRHPDLLWKDVESRILRKALFLDALQWMEDTGGEPDVIGVNPYTGEYCFCDCSTETPSGRRNVCYDQQARLNRKDNPPVSSALELAAAAGLCLLMEDEYRRLQQVGDFDLKTSSWIATPVPFRNNGEALFCEKRHGRVFIYHNKADSYFSVRGFRTVLYI